jgi:hypothetical protein
MGACKFFKQDDANVGNQHRCPNDGSKANPVFPFPKSIQSKGLKRAKKQHINPNGGLPPGRAGNQQRVKIETVPMD